MYGIDIVEVLKMHHLKKIVHNDANDAHIGVPWNVFSP
jgi:hypothetical protein